MTLSLIGSYACKVREKGYGAEDGQRGVTNGVEERAVSKSASIH